MARMVDIGKKKAVRRSATATGTLLLHESTVKAIVRNEVKKGDVVTSSKLAGIQAAKATSTTLPLCHQVPLTSVEIEMQASGVKLVSTCTVSAEYKTGVEMEALVGVAASLLNAWDMVKYLEKDSKGQYPSTAVQDVRVIRKKKGGR